MKSIKLLKRVLALSAAGLICGGVNPAAARGSEAAFQEVAAHRKGGKAEAASADFGKLLQRWNPVGKSLHEVKQVIGTPDWERQDAIGYRFDTGWGGWEWTFVLKDQVVRQVQRTGLD